MGSLVGYADILTPNLTEACILTGTAYDPDMSHEKLTKLCEALCEMGPGKIVISGLERGEDLENFIYEAGKAPQTITEHKAGPCRAGTGDVFSSIIAGDAVNGMNFTASVRHASSFIAKALKRTAELDLPEPDGICFEEFLKEL